MKLKSILLFIIFIGLISSVSGQVYPGLASVQYSMGTTTGEAKNFVSDFSFRGFCLDYDKYITRQVAVGFLTGWNIFDQLNRSAILDLPGGTISGTQIRYFNSFPVMAKVSYYLGQPKSRVRPFVSMGIGTYYITQRLEIGLYQIEKDNWHFGLAPAVGVLFPTEYVFLQANVRYNYAFAAENSISIEPFDISYLSFNLGITVPTW